MSPPKSQGPRWDEAERLAALRSYGVMDSEPEKAFDALTDYLCKALDAPMAVVSLIDSERQWFKARVGLEQTETPRCASFCAHAMEAEGGLLVVTDALKDERFRENPLVLGGPNIRFYAGCVLRTGEGAPLGAVAVLDTRPRPEGLTDFQLLTLRTLTDQVMTQLELRRALRQRDEVRETSQRALEASAYVGAWDWEIAADRVKTDARFAALHGVDADLLIKGASIERFLEAVHPDDLAMVRRDIDAAMTGDGVFSSEYRIRTQDGDRWLLSRGQIYFDRDGAPVRFPGVAMDITSTKLKDAELVGMAVALRDSEAQFRALADAMPQMVWAAQPDGHNDYFNARWYEFTGAPVGSTDGEGWAAMFHPDDQERAWTRWRHSLETGDPFEIEYRLKHHSGAYRWTLGRASALLDDDRRVVRWFGTCTDIDELKRLEKGRELVSQELSHRIKNIFAVVTALVALSARQYPEARAFAASLRTRIAALARAHEFVRPHTETSQTTVGATTLHAFFADLFKAYADDEGLSRVNITGEDAVFDDQAATSVALLFHELATNAAKYGALSEPGGWIDLNTRQEADRFILTWTECGGPRLEGPPQRTGFGSSLAALSVEGQLGGRLEREWRPEGLIVKADLPSTALSRRRAAEKSR